MKITSFLIALVLIGVFATTVTLSITDLGIKHQVTYDNSTLEVFEDTQEINDLALELEDKTNNQNTESGVLDIVGSYIGRALDSLKLSTKSFSLFEKMTSKATDLLGLPDYFKVAAITIMLILIVIGIIASAMVKRDL